MAFDLFLDSSTYVSCSSFCLKVRYDIAKRDSGSSFTLATDPIVTTF
jgi:hypothetical protein